MTPGRTDAAARAVGGDGGRDTSGRAHRGRPSRRGGGLAAAAAGRAEGLPVPAAGLTPPPPPPGGQGAAGTECLQRRPLSGVGAPAPGPAVLPRRNNGGSGRDTRRARRPARVTWRLWAGRGSRGREGRGLPLSGPGGSLAPRVIGGPWRRGASGARGSRPDCGSPAGRGAPGAGRGAGARRARERRGESVPSGSRLSRGDRAVERLFLPEVAGPLDASRGGSMESEAAARVVHN